MENIDAFKMRMKVYCECLNRDMKKNGIRLIGEPIVEANFDMSVLGTNIRISDMPDHKYFRVIVTDNKHVGLIDENENIPQSFISNLHEETKDIDRKLILLGIKLLGSYKLQIHLKKSNGYTTKKEYTLKDGFLLPDVDGFVTTSKDRIDEDDRESLSNQFDMSTPNTDIYASWYEDHVKKNKKVLLDSNEYDHSKDKLK